MRRIVMTGVALAALLPAGVAAATTPPDTAPIDTLASTDTAGSEAAPSDSMTIYDDEGNPVGTVTVTGSEVGWADYEEGNDPEAGNEYVRVSVTVASEVTEDTFAINVDNFVLQNSHGFLTTAESIPTAAQAENDEEITTEADLATGESVDLDLTFEVVSSVGPQSVFYRPEDDQLVDVVDFG